MQSLNIKELKLLKLQITQTWHPKSAADGQTDGWTITRPAFIKVIQVKIFTRYSFLNITDKQF